MDKDGIRIGIRVRVRVRDKLSIKAIGDDRFNRHYGSITVMLVLALWLRWGWCHGWHYGRVRVMVDMGLGLVL